MKKLVLLIAFMYFGLSFATTKDNYREEILPTKYTYVTSCGAVAVSYSYEPVSINQLIEWVDAMEEWYCEEL